jgi:cystathionine beta-lyase/cystathionine gamma-synthase
MVDNTTATAALQKPMDLGADIILLSITKFLAGNATVIGGAIVGPETLVEDIRWNTTEFIGSIIPPLDAWMTLQYIETLSMRMQRHSTNALAIAEFLSFHPKVTRVNYSGLSEHPQHELAKQQMIAHGGLLSFVVSDGMAGAAKVMDALKLVVHAVTFGTSRTICMHPATITHGHMTPAERTAAGIDGGLIIEDLEQALSKL